MDIIEFRDYCLSKSGTTEEFPFDNKTLVFKVIGKMYALCDVDNFKSYNVKCDPDWAIELREEFNGIKEGFHMNKKHWNSASFIGDLSDQQIEQWVKDSYNLAVKNMPKKLREQL